MTFVKGNTYGGRPSLGDEPRVRVTFYLTASEHDELRDVAKANEISVSALIRETVRTGMETWS